MVVNTCVFIEISQYRSKTRDNSGRSKYLAITAGCRMKSPKQMRTVYIM